MSKLFVASIIQTTITEARLGGPFVNPHLHSWLVTAKDIAAGVNLFMAERAKTIQGAENEARTILQERSAAVADYVTELRNGPVKNPDVLRNLALTEAAYQGLDDKYKHVEINEFAKNIVDERERVKLSPIRDVRSDPVLRSLAEETFARSRVAPALTDALEYEAIKAVEATDPNKSVKELRGRSFLDYQLSKYSEQLPKPGTTSGYPDGPEKPGGDPAGKGTNNPKPVTNGPSGGAAELPRGEAPETGKPSTGHGNGTPETGRGGATESSGRGGTTEGTTTRPGAGKPAAGEGKSAAGEPARGPGGRQTEPLRAPGGTTAGEPEGRPAPANEPEAKPAPAAEPEAKPGTWDETKPTVPREAPVEPAAKPRTATAEKPTAPEYTPKTARSATEDAFTRNVNIAVKQNAAFEVAAFALEQVQSRLTSDYLNWMVRRAQQDPQFVDRYLTQYGNWQSMSWTERRRYEVDHFFGDGLDFVNSVAFFPEMAKYMQAMQNFYRPASPGDPGMTSTEVTVEPYTGGRQTTDAANRITLGPDGQWHDRSRIYMLTDRDKAAPPPARTPAEKQAPPQTQSRPPAKAPAKSGSQAPKSGSQAPKSGAQQSVDAKMREKSNGAPSKSGSSSNSVNPDHSNGSSSDSHNNRLGEGGGHKPSGGGAPGPSGGGSSGPSNGGSGTSPGTGGSSGGSGGYGDTGGAGSGNGGGGGQSSDPGPDSGNKGPGFGGNSSGGGGADASKRA
ncbi:hypothetical protein OG948_54565 (plasmid) [Embleya sp. NBC_00888]|uniref:hypothetical protein n=1 Tax=Embleya sp. NBC_00888 TaxID=2975960 RepID=UPI00386EAB00|nr:hypothetical protein OG948_54565 [Embleya sp. NBC_00888]